MAFRFDLSGQSLIVSIDIEIKRKIFEGILKGIKDSDGTAYLSLRITSTMSDRDVNEIIQRPYINVIWSRMPNVGAMTCLRAYQEDKLDKVLTKFDKFYMADNMSPILLDAIDIKTAGIREEKSGKFHNYLTATKNSSIKVGAIVNALRPLVNRGALVLSDVFLESKMQAKHNRIYSEKSESFLKEEKPKVPEIRWATLFTSEDSFDTGQNKGHSGT